MKDSKRLKRIVIKEELVELTGNYIDAILLNQLIYWSERVQDFDEFIKQEQENNNNTDSPQNFCKYGWIYKSLRELSEETMLGLSPNTIKSHLKKLEEKGYIKSRENRNNWDRRKEYKINLFYIQTELQKIGTSLEGYRLEINTQPFANTANACADTANPFANADDSICNDCKTVTEITTEITTENNTMSTDPAVDGEKIKFKTDSDEIKIVDYFISQLQKINRKIKCPKTLSQKQKWAKEIDKLIRLDKRAKSEICQVIKFATADKFWCSNVLSTSALRKYYDRLVVKMSQSNFNNFNFAIGDAVNDDVSETELMLAERRRQREEIGVDGQVAN